jgi:hypothetical protein
MPRQSGAFVQKEGLLGAEVLEALVEHLEATGRVHDALIARVKRVRRRRDFDVFEARSTFRARSASPEIGPFGTLVRLPATPRNAAGLLKSP